MRCKCRSMVSWLSGMSMSSPSPMQRTGSLLVRMVRNVCPPRMMDWYAL